MKVNFLLVLLISVLFVWNTSANTLHFEHSESISIKLEDAAYPKLLQYSPKFKYTNSTEFQLHEKAWHFYLVTFDEKEYVLWLDNTEEDIKINLNQGELLLPNLIFLPKEDWLSRSLTIKNAKLKEFRQIEIFYSAALDELDSLIRFDDQFIAEKSYNSLVWDHRSAKRLFNYAAENFNQQFQEDLYTYSHYYIDYWKLLYKLYYQYYHTNAFKDLSRSEIKSKIELDFVGPESQVLVYHHFFKTGTPAWQMERDFKLFTNELSIRYKKLAEAAIQEQKLKDLQKSAAINFLFGVDIDASLKSYFARDSSLRKNVLIFWSIWDHEIPTEFGLLDELKRTFKEHYNFIHICTDAYEAPEKARSLIYKNRVEGFHVLPEQSNAFHKSRFKKALNINEFPFYVITDSQGEVIGSEQINLNTSERLKEKLKNISTKK